MENNKDLLKLIHQHTHLKNEDGEDVPFFCFVNDILDTIDLDMSEEQIAQVALDSGYKVYKAFPEETMVGGLILCAEGCLKEAIDKMYQEFYGEVPTIEEWPIKEEMKEEKEEVDIEALDPEVESRKGSEQLKNKFIDKAASRGATIEFYTEISPKRLDSTWYDGDIALITYKNFEILVSVRGYLKMHLDGVESPLVDVEDLETNKIFTDDELKAYAQDDTLYYDSGNWFEFSIKKIESNVWNYGDELGYDVIGEVGEALDIDYYIDIVIPDVIERYYRTNEDVQLEPSKELPFKYEDGHTYEEYIEKYGEEYNDGTFWDYSLEDLLDLIEDNKIGYKERVFWLIDDRFYETPLKKEENLTEQSKKDPRLAQAGVSGYNQPKRTPNHPDKSHIVVAKEGDKIKTIRFGEQGAETAGKPKKGESERMKAKRKSFKSRHAKNIAKGKMSAAYWANKIKW
jgi:hypothetical protein